MKISYVIAIVLSCTLIQLACASVPGASRNDLDSFVAKGFVEKRNVKNRYLATALRRRQGNPAAEVVASVPTAPTSVDTLLNGIQDEIKQILVSFSDDSNSDQGEEHDHDHEDHLEEKQRKQVFNLVKKLIKALNELLNKAGRGDNTLKMDGVIKSAEKGTMAPLSSSNGSGDLEARGLGTLFKSPAAMDRDLLAPVPGTTDAEYDGGDDGSTHGDNVDKHKATSPPSAAPGTALVPGTPPPPASPKVSDSDGGTDGDDEHHQRHPNPAKKRSSDPDPKEIKEAANEVNNILEELNGAALAQEEGSGAGIALLGALIKQLLAIVEKSSA